MKAKCEAIRDDDTLVPRTCPVCKLGPCSRNPVTAGEVSPSGLRLAAENMANYRARKIANAVDAGDMNEAERMRDLSVPDFLEIFNPHDPTKEG